MGIKGNDVFVQYLYQKLVTIMMIHISIGRNCYASPGRWVAMVPASLLSKIRQTLCPFTVLSR
jgi:hypothetical protein